MEDEKQEEKIEETTTPEEVVEETTTPEPEIHEPVSDEPEHVPAISFPKFEGVQVTAILDDGKENDTHYHCSLANGTTAHVPKELFV